MKKIFKSHCNSLFFLKLWPKLLCFFIRGAKTHFPQQQCCSPFYFPFFFSEKDVLFFCLFKDGTGNQFSLCPFYVFNHLGLHQTLTASSPFVLKGSYFPLCPFEQTISKQNLTQCQTLKCSWVICFLFLFPFLFSENVLKQIFMAIKGPIFSDLLLFFV